MRKLKNCLINKLELQIDYLTSKEVKMPLYNEICIFIEEDMDNIPRDIRNEIRINIHNVFNYKNIRKFL